jgi:putative FmdB family regulatory protein
VRIIEIHGVFHSWVFDCTGQRHYIFLAIMTMEVQPVPIYEYQCTKCGEVFEAFQKVTDKPLSQCKYCHAKVEKLISQSSFQLKGSGWYLTDYARRSSSGSADKPKTNTSSEKATETTTSTETKSSEKSPESKT